MLNTLLYDKILFYIKKDILNIVILVHIKVPLKVLSRREEEMKHLVGMSNTKNNPLNYVGSDGVVGVKASFTRIYGI